MFHDAKVVLKGLITPKFSRVLVTSSILSIYLAYVAFVIVADQGPVDFETLMSIGGRLVSGLPVYAENSYYPLPYVGIFALFNLMPRAVSMAVWLMAPVIIALVITGYRPHGLLFAPVFSHFAGGQSSVFGLLGFFGYRWNLDPSRYAGGFFLALTCLKPQLGIVPVAYAAYRWLEHYRVNSEIPRQAIAFFGLSGLIYLPAFLLRPTWLVEWLSVPRPLFDRAISSAIPRLLLFVSSEDTVGYWIMWLVLSVAALVITWRLKGNSHALDVLVLLSFIISPLMHDYDLIQVLPTIWGPIMPAASIVLSIPGWWTITTQYANDVAWVTFTIIAPGLLVAYILQCRRSSFGEGDSRTSRCPAKNAGPATAGPEGGG